MRQPYKRYMQQQAMQKALENVATTLYEQNENHQLSDTVYSNETVISHQSTPPFYAETSKPTKSRSLNHAKFLSVIAIFCAVFLLAVFAFNH